MLIGLLTPDQSNTGTQLFLPGYIQYVKPKPLELARFLTLLFVIPVTFALLKFRALRKAPGNSDVPSVSSSIVAIAAIAQIFLVCFVAINLTRELANWQSKLISGIGYLVPAVAILVLLRAVYRKREIKLFGTARHLVLIAIPCIIAAAQTIICLLPSLTFDAAFLQECAAFHLPFASQEFAATATGHTNLVDFYPQYQNLLSYLLQPIFSCLGLTTFSFTATMSLLSLVTMLAVLVLFRIYTGGFWRALVLYIPFMAAVSRPFLEGLGGRMHNVFTFYAAMPLRYFGPSLVFLFAALYLKKPSMQRMVIMLIASGLSAVNNLDFGVPALAGALAIIAFTLCSQRLPGAKITTMITTLMFLLPLACLLFFVTITFDRSGSLPNFGAFSEWYQAYVVLGLLMYPMQMWGPHWLVLTTIVACLILAMHKGIPTFFVKEESQDQGLRAGMLLFGSILASGIFFYYLERPEKFMVMLPALLMLLSLLLWECIAHFEWNTRGLLRDRLMIVPRLLMTAVYLVCLGHLSTMPSLSEQARRIGSSLDYYQAVGLPSELNLATYIQERTQDRSQIALFMPYGHELAQHLGLRNLFTYACVDSMLLKSYLKRAMSALREANIKAVFFEVRPIKHGIDSNYDVVEEKLKESGFRFNEAYSYHLHGEERTLKYYVRQ